MNADKRAAQVAATEARVMNALAAVIARSGSPTVVVAATAVVLGRMLAMAQQAGMLRSPLAAEAKHVDDLVRIGLAQQMEHGPAQVRQVGWA